MLTTWIGNECDRAQMVNSKGVTNQRAKNVNEWETLQYLLCLASVYNVELCYFEQRTLLPFRGWKSTHTVT